MFPEQEESFECLRIPGGWICCTGDTVALAGFPLASLMKITSIPHMTARKTPTVDMKMEKGMVISAELFPSSPEKCGGTSLKGISLSIPAKLSMYLPLELIWILSVAVMKR